MEAFCCTESKSVLEQHHSATNYALNDLKAENLAPSLAGQTWYVALRWLVNIKATNIFAAVVKNTFTTAEDTKPSAVGNLPLR
jgi:hypothetical protein